MPPETASRAWFTFHARESPKAPNRSVSMPTRKHWPRRFPRYANCEIALRQFSSGECPFVTRPRACARTVRSLATRSQSCERSRSGIPRLSHGSFAEIRNRVRRSIPGITWKSIIAVLLPSRRARRVTSIRSCATGSTSHRMVFFQTRTVRATRTAIICPFAIRNRDRHLPPRLTTESFPGNREISSAISRSRSALVRCRISSGPNCSGAP